MDGHRAAAVKLHVKMSLDLEVWLDLKTYRDHKLQKPLMTGLILELSRVTSSKPKMPVISRGQKGMADGCNGISIGSTAKGREDGHTSRLTPDR